MLYADVAARVTRTVPLSAVALFEILGYPSPDRPSLLSLEKLNTCYTHQCLVLGWEVASSRMTITLPDEKRGRIINVTRGVLSAGSFKLREAATFFGLLPDATRFLVWARPFLFELNHALRGNLIVESRILARSDQERSVELRARIQRELPTMWPIALSLSSYGMRPSVCGKTRVHTRSPIGYERVRRWSLSPCPIPSIRG
jgi:hypothetical protein